jgi:hypothetical protein
VMLVTTKRRFVNHLKMDEVFFIEAII